MKNKSEKQLAYLLRNFGITSKEIRSLIEEDLGTRRRSFTCPRCHAWVETEISNADNHAVCPACENEIWIVGR